MGSGTTVEKGHQAEQQALLYLRQQGLKNVDRNYYARGGEIDLVMLDGNCLVFVEVRFRRSAEFMQPSHTVDQRKQRKLIRTAALYIARNHRFSMHTLRFDVVAICGADLTRVEWIKDAFRPDNSTL